MVVLEEHFRLSEISAQDKMDKQKEVIPTKKLCKKSVPLPIKHHFSSTLPRFKSCCCFKTIYTENFDLDVLKTRYNLH